LLGMKQGEECEIQCSKDYAYGEEHPDGASLTLILHEIFESNDVSFGKDGSVMKKRVREGEGWEKPSECSKVKLVVEAATDGTATLDGFKPGVLEFTAGEGEVCDALECAVLEMKKGEKAVIVVSLAPLVFEEKLGLTGVKAERVVLRVLLEDFEKATDTWSMSEEEKLVWGTARKERGSS